MNNKVNDQMLMTLGYENREGATFEMRTFIDVHGAMWWAATDLCAVLEIKNPSKAISRLKDNEKQVISGQNLEGLTSSYTLDARIHELIFVNEPGLYRLTFTSRKKEAERLKDWVFTEVLPSIRETGRYDIAEARLEKLAKHESRETQIDMSKNAAKFYIPRYGKQGIVLYHARTCEGFTGRYPKELQAEAKAMKVPSAQRSSGRECIRTFWPATAACVSLQDELVVKENRDPCDAHEMAKLVEPFYEKRWQLDKCNARQLELFDAAPYERKPRKLDARELPNPFPSKQLTS